MVQINIQALLVDRQIEDEDGSLISQVGQTDYLHLLRAIPPQVHVDALREEIL